MPNPIYHNPNGSLDPTITDFFAAYASATISAGVIPMTASAMQIDTPGGPSDDLDTITATNAEAGTALFIRSTHPDRVVTLRHLTGNIYSAGGDVVLNDPQNLVMLVYSGSYWVVMMCCGDAATPIVFTEGSGENRRCVIAERVKLYLRHVVTQAASARAGGVLTVTADMLAALRLVAPGVSASAVNALAISLVGEYADEAAILAAFNDAFWDDVRCAIYCGHASNATLFTPSGVNAIRDQLAPYVGLTYDTVSTLIDLIGADGLTRAVGLHTFTVTLADCEADCACDDPWCYEFDFSVNDGGWDTATLVGGFSPTFIGQYTSGAWRDSATTTVGSSPALITRGAFIIRTLTSTRITRIQVTYDKTNGSFAATGQPRRMTIYGANAGTTLIDTGLIGAESDGTDKVMNWTGNLVLDTIRLRNDSRYSTSGPNGSVALKKVRIEGTGVNPFGMDNCTP